MHLIPPPERIVIILPCCIGDVIMATATLKAIRRAYPNAHIAFAVGNWSRRAIEYHDMLDAILDTGDRELPVYAIGEFWRFVRELRNGNFDLAVSLVRSPLMSLAVMLSGIRYRAGLNSNGRGFGYNIRADIDPEKPRHEAEIYLDVARALGIETNNCYANLPVLPEARQFADILRQEQGIDRPYIIINPAGGTNPGMVMAYKRWPASNFAALADRLAEQLRAKIILLGGPGDGEIIEAARSQMNSAQPFLYPGTLSFPQIGALARDALLYIGNDTGLTHLAAASGAKTVMVLGPTDPTRYAPFTPNSLALWKPAQISRRGVAQGNAADWNWERDGIRVPEAFEQILEFINQIA